jgi:hypothetical protein
MGVSLNHQDSFCRPLPQPECMDWGRNGPAHGRWIWTAQRAAHIEANDVAAFVR